MILNKKFLTKEFIGKLCVVATRFNIKNFSVNNDLLCLSKLMSYAVDMGLDLSKVLTEVYDSEHHSFLQLLGYILNLKINNPNIDNVELQQNLINYVENKVDNITFQTLFTFINAIFLNINSERISNLILDKEFDRMLKFINIHFSLKKLSDLNDKFYEESFSLDLYEESVTDLFRKYKNSIVSKDFTISNDKTSLKSVVEAVNSTSQDVRSVSLLSKIRFCEKKRVAIAAGITNSGKSMFLCHCTGEYLTTPKITDKKNIIFYFTFENSREETFSRVVANVLEETLDDVKELLKNPETEAILMERFSQKIDKNTILRIVELPPKKHSMTTIRAEVEKELMSHNDAEVYAILLDYIDKMVPVDRSNKTKRYDQQLGDIVDDFKGLVNEFECAGLSVSQINRDGAKQKAVGGNINMTHTGGSWEKIENADIVIIIDVDDDNYEELGYISVLLKNEKHRYVKEGSIIAAFFRPQYARFYPNTEELKRVDYIDSTIKELKEADMDLSNSLDCFSKR